jgi:hypothetical protein
MPEQSERPRPHGDPLEDEIVKTENPAQRQSDATDDASRVKGVEEPTHGTNSDANGIPASDERDGEARRKPYDDGAELVSRID